MFNTDISDVNFQLRYFYLIDTNRIIEELQSDKCYLNFKADNTNLLDVFHLIFSKIIDVTLPYTGFILSPNPSFSFSLFGESVGIPALSSSFFLCEASLFHHCVLHSYKRSLQTHIIRNGKSCPKPYLDFASNDPIIKFSITTMPAIEKGCLYSLGNSQKYAPPYGSNEHQAFNGYCKRVLNSTAKYSSNLIRHFNKHYQYSTDNQLFTHKTESTPVAFLFNSKEVRTFDTALNQQSYPYASFLQKYSALYTKYHSERLSLSDADKALFDIVLEDAYGFSLFDYVNELFWNIEHTTSFQTIAELEGTPFYQILSGYLATLPVTYNRSIFLKYACSAVSNSPNLVSMYPPHSTKAMHYESFTPKTKISFSTEALERMNSFFRLLNYSVLPLIENLWLVLSDALDIKFENYLEFIEKYYSVISCDYTHLPDTIFSKRDQVMSFQGYYYTLCKYVQENTKSISENSLFTRGNMQQELHPSHKHNFCKTIREQCIIMDSSLRKDIVHHLLEQTGDYHSNYGYEYSNFINSHANNIYRFSKLLDWDNLTSFTTT